MRSTTAAFYFDLASPLAYLAAERVLHVLPGPAERRPVLACPPVPPEGVRPQRGCALGGARELAGSEGVLPAGAGEERRLLHEEVERRARELELQPIRWPEPFPFDSSMAMRVATYAASIGRAVPFAQAAFRQAFAGGHSLEDPDFVLIAAAACEMHPAAVLRGAELRSVSERLAAVTAAARAGGVHEVPSVVVSGRVFPGERALERAGAWMRTLEGTPPLGAHPLRGHRQAGEQGPDRAPEARRPHPQGHTPVGGAPPPGARRAGERETASEMRAVDAYRLIVTRGGRTPALLADPARVDHIEVVEIDSGEVALFWDRPPQAASKLARALRADLLALDHEEFMARWGTVEH